MSHCPTLADGLVALRAGAGLEVATGRRGRHLPRPALYRSLAVTEARRSASGAYRGTRLRTPTLGIYGAVLYVGNEPSGIPKIFAGYEQHVDDVTWARIPGTGYYIPEEAPEAFLERVLEFFDAA